MVTKIQIKTLLFSLDFKPPKAFAYFWLQKYWEAIDAKDVVH
jgi:hypothetical protein